MKHSFWILLFLFSNLNTGCNDCDGKYYQIVVKDELPNSSCYFKAQAFTNCYSWRDQLLIEFVDSCNTYPLSEKVTKEELYRKYR